MEKIVNYLKILLIVICIMSYLSAMNAFSQSKKSDTLTVWHIEWVNEISNKTIDSKEQKFKNKISNLVLGKRSEVSFCKPVSIIANALDSIIVVDQGNSKILEIVNEIHQLKSANKRNNLQFESLIGICTDNSSHYYFTDSKLNKVFDYNFKSKSFKVLNDSLESNQPTGIAYSNVDSSIWIVETSEHSLSKISSGGKLLKRIGKRGNGNSEFNFPTNICIGENGNIYVVDAMNFRIQIFDKDGEFLSSFGSAGDASGYFARPKGIALDTYGNIYISDALFHVVQVFDKTGKFLYRFGEQGQGEGQFWMPSGLHIDKNNYIYVADTYNSRIQIFKLVNGD